MSQEDNLLCCDYPPFNLRSPDDNAVEYIPSDDTRPPNLHKEWLDKFCTELGYRNLTFLSDMSDTSAHVGFDTTDGCSKCLGSGS